jgi:hypothetical protein
MNESDNQCELMQEMLQLLDHGKKATIDELFEDLRWVQGTITKAHLDEGHRLTAEVRKRTNADIARFAKAARGVVEAAKFASPEAIIEIATTLAWESGDPESDLEHIEIIFMFAKEAQSFWRLVERTSRQLTMTAISRSFVSSCTSLQPGNRRLTSLGK